MTSRRLIIPAALVVGLAARLYFALTTFGTNDASFILLWSKLAREFGVAGAYARHELLNHPPLSLSIFAFLGRIGDAADLLRLVQIAADVVSFACLLRLANDKTPALLFFLSPVAILISGFHCNTDPTMIALMLVSVVLLPRSAPASGVALAFATGIKIVPLLVVPLFLVAARERWWRWLAGYAIAFAILFAPVFGNEPAMRNIFGYAGHAWWWGFPALAARVRALEPLALLQLDGTRYIVAFVVLAVAALFARRKDPVMLPGAIALAVVAILFVSVGMGVQYLVWPIAFLPFLFKRWETLTLQLAMSLFLAAMYTSWSRGWPWTYADSFRMPWPYFEWLVRGGFVVWVMLGAATLAGGLRMFRRDAVQQQRDC